MNSIFLKVQNKLKTIRNEIIGELDPYAETLRIATEYKDTGN